MVTGGVGLVDTLGGLFVEVMNICLNTDEQRRPQGAAQHAVHAARRPT